jgi:hypothetical protein
MSPLSRQFQSFGRKPMPISRSFGRSAAQVITNGSINDRHLRREHRRQVYAACASWLRASRRSLRKLGSVQASTDGRPRFATIARVNVDPADAEDSEAGLRRRAANFGQGVAVTSARRRH